MALGLCLCLCDLLCNCEANLCRKVISENIRDSYEELIVMDRRFHSGRFSGWLSRYGNCKKEAELHATEETTHTRQIAEISL